MTKTAQWKAGQTMCLLVIKVLSAHIHPESLHQVADLQLVANNLMA